MKKIIILLLPFLVISLMLNVDSKVVQASVNNEDIVVQANSSWGETYPYGNWTDQEIKIVKDGNDNSCLKIQPTAWYPSKIGFRKDVSTDVLQAGVYQLKVDVKSSAISSVSAGKIDFILVYEGGSLPISDGISNLTEIKSDSWTTLSFDFNVGTSVNSDYAHLDAFYWAEETLENNYVLVDNIRFLEKNTGKDIDKVYGGDFEFYHNDVESVSLSISNDFKIGQVINPDLKIKLQSKPDSKNITANQKITVNYEITNKEVLHANENGNLIALSQGTTLVKAIVNFYGTELISNQFELSVTNNHVPEGTYVENVRISLDKNIDLYSYSQIIIDVYLSDGTLLSETDYEVKLSSSNKDVCHIRSDQPYLLIGMGNGNATVYATVTYDGYIIVGSLDVSLETDNLLINPSFEAEYYAWKMTGNSGGGFDNFKAHGYARTGWGNIWLMAPVYWNANVKPDSEMVISQNLNLEKGKYSFHTYINRFYATGVNGLIIGVGGVVTLGAVKLDGNGNPAGEPSEAHFDTTYGNNVYGKLAMVFDVLESGEHLIYIKVVGDPKLGLGMQIDDAVLNKAKYPIKITATIGEDSIEVDDIYKILVYAEYEDGTKELLSTDLRYVFEDYKVACDSKGFVVGRTPGETNLTIKAQILDKVYETTIPIKVNGTAVQEEINTKNYTGAIAGGITAAVLVGAGVVGLIIFSKKRRKQQ